MLWLARRSTARGLESGGVYALYYAEGPFFIKHVHADLNSRLIQIGHPNIQTYKHPNSQTPNLDYSHKRKPRTAQKTTTAIKYVYDSNFTLNSRRKNKNSWERGRVNPSFPHCSNRIPEEVAVSWRAGDHLAGP